MLNHLTTEQRNPHSDSLDSLSALEIVTLMNREDAQVAAAIHSQAATIAAAVDVNRGPHSTRRATGVSGAGTSGRLGVLDAAECPPTFSTPADVVLGVIAGGPSALTTAVEAGRSPGERRTGLAGLWPAADVLVGIATTGVHRT